MDEYTAKPEKSAVHSRDLRQDAGGNHDRHGGQAAEESRDRSPSQRAQDVQTGTFDFPVEWVGLDEQADPNLVNGGVRDAENQSIEDVSHQGAEDGAPLLRRPIERHS